MFVSLWLNQSVFDFALSAPQGQVLSVSDTYSTYMW